MIQMFYPLAGELGRIKYLVREERHPLVKATRLLVERGYGHYVSGLEHVIIGERELVYLRVGDTYRMTLATDNGRLCVVRPAEWEERIEKAYYKTTGLYRCWYCNEFTPVPDTPTWYETECEHCQQTIDNGRIEEWIHYIKKTT